nr:MAG TPA: hypothetical protein [Caudoviricetes sp.]
MSIVYNLHLILKVVFYHENIYVRGLVPSCFFIKLLIFNLIVHGEYTY